MAASGQPGVEQAGAVYNCSGRLERCERIPFDTTGTERCQRYVKLKHSLKEGHLRQSFNLDNTVSLL